MQLAHGPVGLSEASYDLGRPGRAAPWARAPRGRHQWVARPSSVSRAAL